MLDYLIHPVLSPIPSASPRDRSAWAALLGGSALSLVVAIAIGTRAFVLGSSSAGWVHQYLYAFQPRSIAIFLIVIACCAIPAMVPLVEVERHEWRLVGLWLAVGMLAQGVLRGLSPFTMEGLFLGDGSNGFYQPTLKYGLVELLRHFETIRPALPLHPSTNMPGKLILIYGLEIVSRRPAVLAWLTVLVSNLGAIPLYLFVRDYLRDREAALLSVVFYLFVPARLVFFPILNTVTPVLVLVCAWLWLRLLQRRQPAYGIALGAASYAVLFYEPTPAITGVLFLVLTGYAVARREISWRTVAVSTAWIAAGFLLTYIALLAVFRFDLIVTMRGVARDAVTFNARVRRPYAPWVIRNLIDLAFGAGICQAALFAWALVHRGRARASDRRAWMLSVGIAAAILTADLAGINRGEVVRLWIFLACLMQVPAAVHIARLDSRLAVVLVLGTTLLQTALSTSMLSFAQP